MDTIFRQEAGNLKVNPGKLSLADCFALALTIRIGAMLVTSDHHEFDRIAELGRCQILFIRSSKQRTNMPPKPAIIIFAVAFLLTLAPPARAAKHTAELFLQTAHAASVNSVSFSPDGKPDCFKK